MRSASTYKKNKHWIIGGGAQVALFCTTADLILTRSGITVLITFLEFKIVPCLQVSQVVHNGVDIVMNHTVESLNQYILP